MLAGSLVLKYSAREQSIWVIRDFRVLDEISCKIRISVRSPLSGNVTYSEIQAYLYIYTMHISTTTRKFRMVWFVDKVLFCHAHVLPLFYEQEKLTTMTLRDKQGACMRPMTSHAGGHALCLRRGQQSSPRPYRIISSKLGHVHRVRAMNKSIKDPIFASPGKPFPHKVSRQESTDMPNKFSVHCLEVGGQQNNILCLHDIIMVLYRTESFRFLLPSSGYFKILLYQVYS